MAGYQVCLHLLALSMATANRSVLHVCAQNSFSSLEQEPHTCFTASGTGNLPRTHTYTRTSGRSKTVTRAQVPSWAHFRFLQWRCSKNSRNMTHMCPCWQTASPDQNILTFPERAQASQENSHGAKSKQGLPALLWHFFQSDFQPHV